MTVLRGRKELADFARRGQGVAVRHVKRQAVRQNAAGVDYSGCAVEKGLMVELTSCYPVGFKKQMSQSKLERVLEVPALKLEVVLGEVHALFPYNSRQVLHVAIEATLPTERREVRTEGPPGLLTIASTSCRSLY